MHKLPISNIGITGLMASVFSAAAVQTRPRYKPTNTWRNQHPHWLGRISGYKPHQSTKECTKRINKGRL